MSNAVTLDDIAFLHQLDDEEIAQERRHKHLVPSYLEEFSRNNENDHLPTNLLLVDETTPLYNTLKKRFLKLQIMD
ncbi:hypothetical protein LMK05_07360 [Lactococcus petauri]|nr:hypothetical protein LMK05_07360 [Lactococcus petauri]